MAQAERAVDDAAFVNSTEPFRRELLAHCYRMLGSLDDAEDVVQEVYLRAWRAYGGFQGRSSLRTWLYQIATHACLSALHRRARRVLPSGLGAPSDDVAAAGAAADPDISWLQPLPDALVTPESDDPASIVAFRSSLRLALIASLQYLPGRQRAVLLLRDVLAWPAAEVAEVLGTSVAAVKSILQRARARLEEVAPVADRVAEPTEPQVRALLDEYVAAFEHADAPRLARLLRQDVTLELPPSRTWFAGKHTIASATLGLGSPGQWRMLPTFANGQAAAVTYLLAGDGQYHAYGVVVLETTATGLSALVVFAEPRLVERFGLPPVLPN
jgi:RNA polymerase sigma-70 factor (ECF subfamily)